MLVQKSDDSTYRYRPINALIGAGAFRLSSLYRPTFVSTRVQGERQKDIWIAFYKNNTLLVPRIGAYKVVVGQYVLSAARRDWASSESNDARDDEPDDSIGCIAFAEPLIGMVSLIEPYLLEYWIIGSPATLSEWKQKKMTQ